MTTEPMSAADRLTPAQLHADFCASTRGKGLIGTVLMFWLYTVRALLLIGYELHEMNAKGPK